MDEQDNLLLKTKVQHKNRYEAMLFNYKTTPLTDYRFGLIWEPKVETKYEEKASHVKPWKEPLKESQTMTDWRGKVRFDLFMKPKEIVQTDPRKIQQKHESEDDMERELVRKTRPRMVLTPATAIDDVSGRELKLILEDMYSSTTQKEMRAGVASSAATKNVVSPLVPIPAPAVPIKLEKYLPHAVVPSEWRMDSASWDGRQLRAYCHPEREFWSRPRDTQPIGKRFD